jgi:peptidoglycan/LPS O-acetylase OafA/YrhL
MAASGVGWMSLAAGREEKFYVPALDGVRAIAFLLVFTAHAGLERVVPGGLGVTIFFFLSGYLITTLLRLEGTRTGTVSLRKFYLRRALRILPPFYITLALAFLLGLCGVMWIVAKPVAYLTAATFCLNYYEMLPNRWLWIGPGLGIVWSLCIEEHFYLVFPAVYRSFLRRSLASGTQVKILLGGCLVALVWRMVVVAFIPRLGIGPKWAYATTDCRFDSILWGVILALHNNAWFGDRREDLLARHKGLLAVAGLAGLVLSLVVRNEVFMQTARFTLQGLCLYPVFYYCVATDTSWAIRLLRLKALRWIGTLSYTLYLCHLYILRELQIHSRGRMLLVDAAIAAALAVAYAWTMNRLVESPLKRWRLKFASG